MHMLPLEKKKRGRRPRSDNYNDVERDTLSTCRHDHNLYIPILFSYNFAFSFGPTKGSYTLRPKVSLGTLVVCILKPRVSMNSGPS